MEPTENSGSQPVKDCPPDQGTSGNVFRQFCLSQLGPGELLAPAGWRPGILFHSPQGTGHLPPPPQRITQVDVSVLLRLRNLCPSNGVELILA